MTSLALLLAVLGAGYVSWLLTRFLIWFDGADALDDEPETYPETACTNCGEPPRAAQGEGAAA